MNLRKQLIDQTAHFGIGGLLVWILTPIMPDEAGFGVMMLLAFARELWQHRGFDFGPGAFLDLAFWALGGIAALQLIPG